MTERITGAEVRGVRAKLDALRGEAEQWRAFVACRDHEMRDKQGAFGWSPSTGFYCWGDVRPTVRLNAPTPVELLARLDALAEVTKPKERRLWRWSNGTVIQRTEVPGQPGVYSYDLPGPLTGDNITGTPVREVVRPDGVIELHPEGT